MIKQPYITLLFAFLLFVSILMISLGYSAWWYVGVVIGFYGLFIALLHYFRIDED